jgi:hypothetical protein
MPSELRELNGVQLQRLALHYAVSLQRIGRSTERLDQASRNYSRGMQLGREADELQIAAARGEPVSQTGVWMTSDPVVHSGDRPPAEEEARARGWLEVEINEAAVKLGVDHRQTLNQLFPARPGTTFGHFARGPAQGTNPAAHGGGWTSTVPVHGGRPGQPPQRGRGRGV